MILGSAQAVLDGAGAGRASIGPERAGHRWMVRRLTLRASAGRPTARVYRDSESVSTFVDGTTAGDANSSELVAGLDLWSGQSLLAVWTAGTPGASVTLILDGDISVLGE